MTAELRGLLSAPRALVDPAERRLAGRLAGLLYVAGAAVALGLWGLAPGLCTHPRALLALGCVGSTWAVVALFVIAWERASPRVLAVQAFAGLACCAVSAWATGGAQSPGRLQVVLVVVYAAYFLSPQVALLATALSGAVLVAPLVALPQPDEVSVATQVPSELSTILLTGLVMITASAALRRSHGGAELLGRRQQVLGALATSVAAEQPLEDTMAMAAEQLIDLLDADTAAIVRFDPQDEVRILGTAISSPSVPHAPLGARIRMRPGGEFDRLRATRRPVRVDDYSSDPGSTIVKIGLGCFVAVPVFVAGRTWGALSAATLRAGALPHDVDRRLADVAEVLGLAVVAAGNRRQLTEQALTDPLTGLFNRRWLHERLEQETGRALRHGRGLTLMLVDVDAFKAVNDSVGHGEGDRALLAVADALRAGARRDDIVGRLGGDEFAVVFPEATALEALNAVERARRALAQHSEITFSAGLCELAHAPDAATLLRCADSALYCAKEQGHGLSWIFDPEVASEMGFAQRRERRRRSDALSGLRSLARAIDAKDHGTREHSTRVADLAAALAVRLGWDPERAALLREAGVLHDVGKIGVPDAVLLKPGRLTQAEYEQVKQHAALGAQILDGALTSEQVVWVRGHHERPDGRGYPDGLDDAHLSDGAAILAVADAFDAMTASRPYGAPLPYEVAMEECRRLAGQQFRAAVVDALQTVEAPEVDVRAG